MKLRMLLAVTLLLLGVSGHAQPTVVEHPALRYDPVTARYTLAFPANSDRRKALRSVSWSSQTLIDPAVDISVQALNDQVLEYRYIVSNGAAGKQRIAHFWLAPIVRISGISHVGALPLGKLPLSLNAPKYLKVTAEQKIERDTYVAALIESRKRLQQETVNSVAVNADWRPNVSFVEKRGGGQLSFMVHTNDGKLDRGIGAGQSMAFSFRSDAVPGIISIPFYGSVDSPLLPSEDDRTDEETAAWRKWQNEDYKHVLTIAPSRERPDPFNRVTLLQTMREEIESWPGRSILERSQATQIATGLERIAAAAGDVPAARDAAKKDLQNLLPVTVTGTAAPVVIQLVNLYISMLD